MGFTSGQNHQIFRFFSILSVVRAKKLKFWNRHYFVMGQFFLSFLQISVPQFEKWMKPSWNLSRKHHTPLSPEIRIKNFSIFCQFLKLEIRPISLWDIFFTFSIHIYLVTRTVVPRTATLFVKDEGSQHVHISQKHLVHSFHKIWTTNTPVKNHVQKYAKQTQKARKRYIFAFSHFRTFFNLPDEKLKTQKYAKNDTTKKMRKKNTSKINASQQRREKTVQKNRIKIAKSKPNCAKNLQHREQKHSTCFKKNCGCEFRWKKKKKSPRN